MTLEIAEGFRGCERREPILLPAETPYFFRVVFECDVRLARRRQRGLWSGLRRLGQGAIYCTKLQISLSECVFPKPGILLRRMPTRIMQNN